MRNKPMNRIIRRAAEVVKSFINSGYLKKQKEGGKNGRI